MNVTQLRKRASELQIPGRSKMSADELREAISSIEATNDILNDPDTMPAIEKGMSDLANAKFSDGLQSQTPHECGVHDNSSGHGKSGYRVNPNRRAKNRMARKSRRINRQRSK